MHKYIIFTSTWLQSFHIARHKDLSRHQILIYTHLVSIIVIESVILPVHATGYVD